MKRFIFITCLLICCSWGYGQTPIIPPPPRKSMNLAPVELAPGQQLTIRFNLDLGAVTVDIISPAGTSMYRNTLPANTGAQLPVGTAGWKAGTYIVRITGQDGSMLRELVYYKE